MNGFRLALFVSIFIIIIINGSEVEENSQDQYHLFGTKTSYLTARKEIRRRYRNVRWPKELDQCKPIYLYLFSRHGIRYPGATDMSFLRELLPSIRNDLIQSGKLSYKMSMYLDGWRFRMLESDSFRLSETGKIETARLAEYLTGYFPRLLMNITEENFEVGTTPKIRTDETAEAFIGALFGGKHYDDDDHDDDDDGNGADESKKKKKKNSLRKKFQTPKILMSHKKCKKIIKSRGQKIPVCEECKIFLRSIEFRNMIERFSQRNGFINQTLSTESFLGLYRACAYELAIYGFSPWCLLFQRYELKIIEYLADLEEYHEAYEIKPHRKIACELILDLKSKIQKAIENDSNGKLNHHHHHHRATFYFSHENLLNKLLSYLELFKSFPKMNSPPPPPPMSSYSETFIQKEYSSNGSINREWRSSLLLSFGSNFVTVLYRCPSHHHHQAQYRLFTMINEIPVRIRGCPLPNQDSNPGFCDVEQFFREFNSTETECDLEHICRI